MPSPLPITHPDWSPESLSETRDALVLTHRILERVDYFILRAETRSDISDADLAEWRQFLRELPEAGDDA